MKQQALNWLSQSVFPLWLEKGVDWKDGGFHEEISLEGSPKVFPRRAMVQGRQIYAFRIGIEMGLVAKDRAAQAITEGTRALLRDYSLPDGAFVHSIEAGGKPARNEADLYTQAFAIFGLANAYAVGPNPEYAERAKKVLDYLTANRQAHGGFFELAHGIKLFQSNPHMHLFEAALAWMEIAPAPHWRQLAGDILKLCTTKFMDRETHLIGEHFDENWQHRREDGKFVFEPGHQFEWSWLMGLYQNLTEVDLLQTRKLIYANADKPEVCPKRGTVYDEVWSDFKIKSGNSRFWPQCERIKAAAQLGRLNSASDSMAVLFKFFETEISGLWYDSWEPSGEFKRQGAKASSLYHIIGAIEQYTHKF